MLCSNLQCMRCQLKDEVPAVCGTAARRTYSHNPTPHQVYIPITKCSRVGYRVGEEDGKGLT